MTVPNAANGRSRRPLAAAMSDADVEMEASSAIPVATKPTEVKRVHSLPMKVPKVSSAGSHIRDSTAQVIFRDTRYSTSGPPSPPCLCDTGQTLHMSFPFSKFKLPRFPRRQRHASLACSRSRLRMSLRSQSAPFSIRCVMPRPHCTTSP